MTNLYMYACTTSKSHAVVGLAQLTIVFERGGFQLNFNYITGIETGLLSSYHLIMRIELASHLA